MDPYERQLMMEQEAALHSEDDAELAESMQAHPASGTKFPWWWDLVDEPKREV